MTNALPIDNKIAEIRDAFDQTYAAPVGSQAIEQVENLLSVRLAGAPYAIRISEVSGLVNNRRIVPIPSPVPELLGVVGIRGGLVPVYSLPALLGYNQDAGQGRWLALCGREEQVGLAFGDFEGYLRIPLAQLYAVGQKDGTRARVEHVLRTGDAVRPVVSIPYLLEMIQRRCGETRISKER